MDFDLLLSSSPEAQLALMNTMLQLEQALIADQSPMASSVDTSSPPISPVQTPPHSHSLSPPPHVSSLSSTTTDASAIGYNNQDMCFSMHAAYCGAGACTGIGAQKEYYVSPGGTGAPAPQPQPQRDAMREMIFHIAALQPVMNDDDVDAAEAVRPAKKQRRNVRTSKDPQSVAARLRRERISERIRVLQRLVPGGTKMDTASMLDEAIHYVKFLKSQVQSLELAAAHRAAAFGAGAAYPAALQHAPW